MHIEQLRKTREIRGVIWAAGLALVVVGGMGACAHDRACRCQHEAQHGALAQHPGSTESSASPAMQPVAPASQPASQPAATPQGHGHGHHQHHGMQRRFRGAKHWARVFDDPRRDRWQRPDAVLKQLALAPAMRVVDIGAGTGYFAVRLARGVPHGRVWAVDVEQEMVAHINARAVREKLPQIAALRGDEDDPRIPEPVDLVFVCNTYHHIQDRVGYFRRVRAKLKRGGRLAVVDFKMGKIPVGPAEKHRITPRQLRQELAAAGYRTVDVDEETLPYQYIATAR